MSDLDLDATLEAILMPIEGDNPAGEDLKYTVYDEIKEAKKEDDTLDRGDWESGEIKTADWDSVVKLSIMALTDKTKDLQIAVWLTEALTRIYGFDGVITGLKIIAGFLEKFWDNVYPVDEEDESETMDSRAGILEHINNKISILIKQVPLTSNNDGTPGYTLIKWEESRGVGYDRDVYNQNGDVDEKKKSDRNEKIAEGKLPADAFDSAAESSSGPYYVSLDEKLAHCKESFEGFDSRIDEKFSRDTAPMMADFRKSLEDLDRFLDSEKIKKMIGGEKLRTSAETDEDTETGTTDTETVTTSTGTGQYPEIQSAELQEQEMFRKASDVLRSGGLSAALGLLFKAAGSVSSEREKYRYRLLTAQFCQQHQDYGKARPIIEELHKLIEELKLEQWESPSWIADVYVVLHQCLTKGGEPSDEDNERAKNLYTKICMLDITKAEKC